MERQLYASFVRARAGGSNLKIYYRGISVVLSICTALMFHSSSAWAAESPVSPKIEDPAFLAAPSFELVEQPKKSEKPAGHSSESSDVVRVGDPLVLKISGAHLEGLQDLSFSGDLQEQGWNADAKIRSQGVAPDSEYFISVTPVKSGKITLPSLSLKDASGKILGRTNPFNLEVTSAIKSDDPHPQEPAALEPPVSLQFPWWIISIGIILGMGALGCVGYALYRWNQRRKSLKSKKVEIILPEDEVALTQLTELEKKELLKQGHFKSHYFGISEILKVYIGARYRFDAPESTTQEMFAALESKEVRLNSTIESLERLFHQLDFVKFTDHTPQMGESAQLIGDAREFIMKTRLGADRHASQ